MKFGEETGACFRIKDYIHSRIEKCKICFVAIGITMAYKGLQVHHCIVEERVSFFLMCK